MVPLWKICERLYTSPARKNWCIACFDAGTVSTIVSTNVCRPVRQTGAKRTRKFRPIIICMVLGIPRFLEWAYPELHDDVPDVFFLPAGELDRAFKLSSN